MRNDAVVALLIGLLACAATVASAEPAALDVTVPPASVRVGDRVPVRIAGRGGEDLMWGELQTSVETAGAWAVVDGPRELAGTRPPAWEVVLAPMDVGELSLPVFKVTVRNGDGTTATIVASELATVDVVSVLPDADEVQPAPLRGPLGVSGFPWEWWLPLAIPVLGAAAALAWLGRRRRSRQGGAEVVILAPLDEFEALLERLVGRIGREPAESICDRLAGGFRHYLERTTSEPAGEMTSFELRLLARKLDWPDTVRRGLQSVMAVADRVRFGRLAATEGELREAIGAGRDVARSLEQHLAVEDDEDPAELEAVG